VAYGTEEQKRRYLPKIATGESSVAFALTEADSGTGLDLASAAIREGDYYILNGEKHLITNAEVADLFMTCCWTNKKLGRKGLSALMVDRNAPGFTLKPMPHHMGCNGIWHGILEFRNVKVPIENLVGKEGDGLEIFLGELEPSRVFVAASSLGTAERALEIALDYAKKRVTFGKPIAQRETIRALLADMAMDVYGLRLMLKDVGNKIDKGEGCSLEASITKLFGLEAVIRVTDKAMQVLGGRAYVQNYPSPFERIYREARINVLEEGTPSVQRLVAARSLIMEKVPLRIGTLDPED
jgi:alkylation response protein AidB-like acyl-CoA dehydrogenase